jgi:predicted lipase
MGTNSIRPLLQLCLRSSSKAYIPNQPEEYTRGGSTVCIYESDPSNIMVAFRGTEPCSPTDWMSALNFNSIYVRNTGYMHAGIYQSLALVEEHVVATINKYMSSSSSSSTSSSSGEKHKKVTVTGHSMGGAMACMFAAMYPDIVHTCVTFASPCVCDKSWKDYMESSGVTMWRVENDKDLIPHLIINYAFVPVGKLVFLQDNGNITTVRDKTSLVLGLDVIECISDHTVRAYELALSQSTILSRWEALIIRFVSFRRWLLGSQKCLSVNKLNNEEFLEKK